jgi:hypothetical protein
VHPEILQAQRLPPEVLADRDIWKRRTSPSSITSGTCTATARAS